MKRNFGVAVIKVLVTIVLIVVLFSLAIGLAFSIYVDKNMEKSIDEELFSLIGSGSSSEVFYYSSQEKEKAVSMDSSELFGGYRSIYVEYDSIPQDMIDAFISIEDKRFFTHNGVDWKRTISATFNYFLKFSGNFGGSTITQQLIKNVTDRDEYSFQRKIQEIIWALDLETKLDKKEILESYLNIINLAHGCYGVGTYKA